MPERMVGSQIGIFDDPMDPFINFPRDIGCPFAVPVWPHMPKQWAVAVFGDDSFPVEDQPLHDFRVQWHVPSLVPLGGAARLPVFFTDKQEPFSRYHLLGIAV